MKAKSQCIAAGVRGLLMAVCLAIAVVARVLGAQSATTVSGLVRDANAPVAGATVRVQTTENATSTDTNGHFTLTVSNPDKPVILTAWAKGYYVGGGNTRHLPGSTNVEIVLAAHSEHDNPDYEWLSAFANPVDSGSGEDNNCEKCHADPNDQQGPSPFGEWLGDAHSLSARNHRFLTMYSGTDVFGNQSPSTRYIRTRDYGRVPLRPDPNQPYFGPGYKLDFPDTAGNCAACHAPAAAIDGAYNTDPTTATGVGAEGVTCDFCHKVWDVRLDPASGMPYPNMPGVLSFEFRRPPEGHQFFAGPFGILRVVTKLLLP